MSRLPSDNRIIVRPVNNIYTALAGAGVLALLVAIITLVIRANALFPSGWGFPS